MAAAVAEPPSGRWSRQKACRAAATARRSAANVASSESGATTASATEVGKIESSVRVLHQQLHGRLRPGQLGVRGSQPLDALLEQLQRGLELHVVALQLRH